MSYIMFIFANRKTICSKLFYILYVLFKRKGERMRLYTARGIITLALLLFYSGSIHASVFGDEIQTDTIKKKGFIAKVWDYFSSSNEDKSDKKFDFSIIGAPRYSSDKKLGVAALAAGIYSTDRADTTLMKSDISLVCDISTVGYKKLELYGNHIFPHDRFRLIYDIYGFIFPSYTWGIGYDMCNWNGNKTDLTRGQIKIKADLLIRVTDKFLFGPTFAYDYIHCDELENPDILPDFDRITNNVTLGITAVYDTRDIITNPHKGFYLNFMQSFRPKMIGNDHAFSTSELITSCYTPLWKGCTLACNFNSMFN